MKNILISGGSGLVGTAVSNLLKEKGYSVKILSRNKSPENTDRFYWNYEEHYLQEEAIEFADIIIHLAGENIAAKPWTTKQKTKIVESRIATTQLLYKAIEKAKKKPKYFISASAVGFYGSITSEHIFEESSIAANDFLATTTAQWEQEVTRIRELGVDVSIFRLGIVLSKRGGALAKMSTPVKYGLASALGRGNQFMPWIAIDDLARMFLFAIEREPMNQIFNAVAPQHITNKEFIKTLAKSMNKPFFLPALPSFVLKLIFGEMADILLEGSRVSSRKILSEGFQFKFSILKDYLDFKEY